MPPIRRQDPAAARQAWRGDGGAVFEADPLSGPILFWADTLASLQRLGMGVASRRSARCWSAWRWASCPGPGDLRPAVAVIAVIPPIALLPILFIALGLGETAKVALIAIGIAPS
jgi:NitT/TauT family transport system permease protein